MTVESIIRPKQPQGDSWIAGGTPPQWVTLGYAGETWYYPDRKLQVISAVEVAEEEPGKANLGPTYHVSISRGKGRRCSSNDVRFVLTAFGMQDAEEDNHVPGGFVRNFWLSVNENLIGVDCPCKASEPAIVEDKGDFVWRGITK